MTVSLCDGLIRRMHVGRERENSAHERGTAYFARPSRVSQLSLALGHVSLPLITHSSPLCLSMLIGSFFVANTTTRHDYAESLQWFRLRAQQKKFADTKRREEQYKVVDQVMLTTDKLAEGRGKLRDRWVGPFTVVEAFDNGVNVRLDLPKQYSKLHPVFHVEKLKRFIPSSMDWPGREQPKRPKPRLVNGRRKYWALRIIDKKEEDIEVTTRIEEKDDTEQLDDSKRDDVPTAPVPLNTARRISPRDHASTRAADAPVVLPQWRKKPRVQTVKETRRVVFYKVEWKGYGPEDATWKTEEEVIEEGLQWMIHDHEMAVHQRGDELDVATICVFSPCMEGGKRRLRCACS